MEAIRNNPELYVHVELHLDEVVINPDGFFRRTLLATGIWDFITAKPTKILSEVVANFLLHLEDGKFVTSIDPQTSTRVPVLLKDVAAIFNLPAEGETNPPKIGIHTDDECPRFSID